MRYEMIQIAADNQSLPELIDIHLSQKLSRLQTGDRELPDHRPPVAFVGYSVWRRDENGDANLFDEQVFVVRDGRVRFLDPRYDLEKFSLDGLSWGYAGSAPSQLAIAMLMEVLGDWKRVKGLYPRFHDHFVMKLPKNANWTADGSDILAMALTIARDQHILHSL